MAHVGELILQRREALRMTQKQLESRTGLEQTYISKVENGRIRRPEREMLDLFALGLELDPNILYLAVFGERQEVSSGEEIRLRTRGRVPADITRWALMQEEYEGRDVQIPVSWLESAVYPLFAVDVSGDCLAALKIADGDVVICEEYHDQPIPNGKVVLVQVDGQCTLKQWYQTDMHAIELRDGNGGVARELSESDTFDVLGVVIKVFGDR